MANTLLTTSIIAREALMRYRNNLVFAGLVHRNYSDDFVNVGDTITVRKPATFTVTEHDGSTLDIKNAVEGSTTVKLNKIPDISVEITQKDLNLNIQDFGNQFLEGMAQAHAQYVDAQIAALYADIPYSSDVSSTATVADLANLDKVMNLLQIPLAQRKLVLSPQEKSAFLSLDAFARVDASGSNQSLRDATLGRVMGFDTYMDQNIVSHAKGDLATGAALSGSAGALTGTIASGGNAKTIKKGDTFTIDTLTESAPTNQFVCTADMTTDGSGAGTLSFYPALPSNISSKAITVKASKRQNLAFHKNAFAFVTRPLEAPMGGAESEQVSFEGLSLRLTMQYDIQAKKNVLSLDQLVGFKTLSPELAVRLRGQ